MKNTSTENKTFPTVKHRIPDELVYERINGKPVYYKGYEEVIKQNKQIEEIMGSSDIQAIIVDIILRQLYFNLDLKNYKILTNEVGIHLNKNNNIATDIAIFKRNDLFSRKIQGKYVNIPPQLVIEIDTKADLSDFDNVMDYYQAKTTKLFNFGVEKVVWILTTNQHIIEATPDASWLIKKWNDDIDLLDDIVLNIKQLLIEEGVWELID